MIVFVINVKCFTVKGKDADRERDEIADTDRRKSPSNDSGNGPSPQGHDNLDAAVDLDEETPPEPDWRRLTVRVVAQHEPSGAAMEEEEEIPVTRS